jgi:GNAT superfamily N-acetyltransferase
MENADPHRTIRPAAAGDIPLIERFMPRRMPGTHRERLEKQGRGDVLYLIAWLGGVPVGHLLIKWNGTGASTPLASCPTLSDIAVHPNHQSKGIGSSLMDYAERLVEQHGHDCVSLKVAIDNVRARDLYEHRGYQDSGLGTVRSPYLTVFRTLHGPLRRTVR